MADYPVSIDLVRRKLLEMRDGMEPDAIAVLNMALTKLEGFPAMDVVHGRWVMVGKTFLHSQYDLFTKCSVCSRVYVRGDYQEPYHYCPNCGAKMDLVEDTDAGNTM